MLNAWTSLVSCTNTNAFLHVATKKENTRTADASGCGQLHLHSPNDLEEGGAADLSAIYDGPYFSTGWLSAGWVNSSP